MVFCLGFGFCFAGFLPPCEIILFVYHFTLSFTPRHFRPLWAAADPPLEGEELGRQRAAADSGQGTRLLPGEPAQGARRYARALVGAPDR